MAIGCLETHNALVNVNVNVAIEGTNIHVLFDVTTLDDVKVDTNQTR